MTVLVSDDGAVRTITMNRPEVRNAIDIPMRLAMAEALQAADSDDAVRCVVLTGAGASFCSGGDVATMAPMPEDQALARVQLAQRVIRAIWATTKPVLSAVEGAAYGAGTALAAACDRVIAARDARFATTFLNVGLAGDMGAYVSLPARMGTARARQMLMTGRPLDAREALDAGLVDALADPGEALTRALADAQLLAARPAAALRSMKALLAVAPRLDPLDVLDREAAQQASLFGTDDFAEGVTAFREKRLPRFGPTQGVRQ